MEQSQNKFSVDFLNFLKKDELRTPEEEIDVRLVLAENAALKDEVAELKEQLAQLKKSSMDRKVKRPKSFWKQPNRLPAPMIPHSFCSPELLAHIVYEKYCNAMPLYRLEKDFGAKGANISRTTMANWIIMASQLWVKPIWEQMHRELVTSSVIHADETVVQVLNEPGKKAKTDSRMWVYCSGKVNDHSNILFEYQPTRNGDHTAKFLGDYPGYVICDGFDGYNKLKIAKRCGCRVTQ